jgi:hypothetical protein
MTARTEQHFRKLTAQAGGEGQEGMARKALP